jgi:hypothetical protein
MKDPYAQDKAELIASKLRARPSMELSRPVLYRKGTLDCVLEVVRLLQHRCGFPETKYQVKFNADIGVLRLSDYFTRHAGEPGEHFWMFGDVIMGGDLEQHVQLQGISEWAQGKLRDPQEGELTANNWAIVVALKKLREESNVVTQSD